MRSAADGGVGAAVASLARGGMVVVTAADGLGGALVVAAECVTERQVAFMLAHTSGLVSVAMTPDRLDALDLPVMVAGSGPGGPVPYTVTVDARAGTSTGISAGDRVRTIRALVSPVTRPDDLARPGHVFPIRTDPGGVLHRRRPPEAALDLVDSAQRYPAAVVCDLVSTDRRRMASAEEARGFAVSHGLVAVGVESVELHRHRSERLARRVARARIPTVHGSFTAYVYQWSLGDEEDLVLVRGPVAGRDRVPVAVHAECLVGDVFGSRGCSCSRRLDTSLRWIDRTGHGVLVYLRSSRSGLGASPVSCAAGGTPAAWLRGAHILRDLGIASAVVAGEPAAAAVLGAVGIAAVPSGEPRPVG